jgi:hypothetical protein
VENEIQTAHAVERVQAEAPEAAHDLEDVLSPGEEVEVEASEEVKWSEIEVRRVARTCSEDVFTFQTE